MHGKSLSRTFSTSTQTMSEAKSNEADTSNQQGAAGPLRPFDMSVQQRLEVLSDERQEEKSRWDQTQDQLQQILDALSSRSLMDSPNPPSPPPNSQSHTPGNPPSAQSPPTAPPTSSPPSPPLPSPSVPYHSNPPYGAPITGPLYSHSPYAYTAPHVSYSFPPPPVSYGLNPPGPGIGSDPALAILAEFDKPSTAPHAGPAHAHSAAANGPYQHPPFYYGHQYNPHQYSAHPAYPATSPFPGSDAQGPAGQTIPTNRAQWNPHTQGPPGPPPAYMDPAGIFGGEEESRAVTQKQATRAFVSAWSNPMSRKFWILRGRPLTMMAKADLQAKWAISSQ